MADIESLLDPEMAAFVRADAVAVATLGPFDPSWPAERKRDYYERRERLPQRPQPVMAVTADRRIPARGHQIFARLYRPTVEPALPVVVYLHGGGWNFCSVETHDGIVRALAAASRMAFLSVDYTLAPEAKFPQALEECAAVVRWLRAHAGEWDLDPARIVVAGDSAGGNLAIGTALLLRDGGGPALDGILLAYPVCDATFDTESYRELGDLIAGSTEMMRGLWHTYTRDPIDLLHPLAAPLRADLRGLPPTLLLIAEIDVLRSEAVALAEKLRAAGVDTECEVFQGLNHSFLRAVSHVRRVQEAVELSGRWLQRVMHARR